MRQKHRYMGQGKKQAFNKKNRLLEMPHSVDCRREARAFAPTMYHHIYTKCPPVHMSGRIEGPRSTVFSSSSSADSERKPATSLQPRFRIHIRNFSELPPHECVSMVFAALQPQQSSLSDNNNINLCAHKRILGKKGLSKIVKWHLYQWHMN